MELEKEIKESGDLFLKDKGMQMGREGRERMKLGENHL